MSGHSHYQKIKHDKGTADAERGKSFSKVIKLITVAAREGGDPEMNPKLKAAILKAKEINMPVNNVERAIKRGTGEIEGVELQEIMFEAFGPANVGIIVEGITDNKNRSLAEIKQVLSKNSGKLSPEGSVRHLFERKGIINLDVEAQTEEMRGKESLELLAIDAEAEDISGDNEFLQIYTAVNNLESVKANLEQAGVEIESSTLGWKAKDEIQVSEKEAQAIDKLLQALDDNDDVQEIYSNFRD